MGRFDPVSNSGNIRDYGTVAMAALTGSGFFAKVNLKAALTDVNRTWLGTDYHTGWLIWEHFNFNLGIGVLKTSTTEYKMFVREIDEPYDFTALFGPTWLIADLPTGDTVISCQIYDGTNLSRFAVAEPNGSVIDESTFTLPRTPADRGGTYSVYFESFTQRYTEADVYDGTADISLTPTRLTHDASWLVSTTKTGSALGARPVSGDTGLENLFEYPEVGSIGYSYTTSSISGNYPADLRVGTIVSGGDWNYTSATTYGRLELTRFGGAQAYTGLTDFQGLSQFAIIARLNLKGLLEGASDPLDGGVPSNVRWLVAYPKNAEIYINKPSSTTYELAVHVYPNVYTSDTWGIADLPSGDSVCMWSLRTGSNASRFAVAAPGGAVIDESTFTCTDAPFSTGGFYDGSFELQGLPRAYNPASPIDLGNRNNAASIPILVSFDSVAIVDSARTGTSIGAKPEPTDADMSALWYFFVDAGASAPNAVAGQASLLFDTYEGYQVGSGTWNEASGGGGGGGGSDALAGGVSGAVTLSAGLLTVANTALSGVVNTSVFYQGTLLGGSGGGSLLNKPNAVNAKSFGFVLTLPGRQSSDSRGYAKVLKRFT